MNVRKAASLIASGCIAVVAAVEYRYASSTRPTFEDESLRQSSLHTWVKSILSRYGISRVVHADSESSPVITPWDWNWDGRHTQTSTIDGINGAGDRRTRRPICSRHLIFVRHGQYQDAEDDADCHLTPLGREQLSITGMRLKQLNFPYSMVYYSTMTRAIESTEEVLKHLVHVQAAPSDALREGAPYQLEPPLSFYQPSEGDLQRDGQRIESAFKSFVHRPDPTQIRDSYEVFVCHANVIRYVVCRALQLPPEAWIRFSLSHGSITWLVVRSDGRVSLRCLGDSGHMPPDKISINNR